MRIYKTLPDLERKRQMTLFQKGVRSDWSPADLDWKGPGALASADLRDRLARVLSPVLMGEQAGLYSITTIIGLLGRSSNTEGQFFLTTMAVDEAKHAEAFSYYYHRLEREPLSIRRLPSSYLFQSEIMSQDPVEWLTGSLVSEVLAKLTVEDLRAREFDPVLSEMCGRILEDEARHLAFNHVFLSDRFRETYRQKPRDAEETAERLKRRLEAVLALVPPIIEALEVDTRKLGIRTDTLHERLVHESRERLERSIGSPQSVEVSTD